MKKLLPGSAPLQHSLSTPSGKPISVNTLNASSFWLPGIRIMGNLKFPAKVLLISLIVLMPWSVTTWEVYIAKSEAIAFSLKERLGIRYIREIFPVIDAGQQLRRESLAAAANGGGGSGLASAKNKFAEALAKLVEIDKEIGQELDVRKGLEECQKTYAATDNASSMTAIYNAHTAHVACYLMHIETVSDNSNLTLDPDLDSFYLMDAALFRLPSILENTGKLRGLGMTIMQSGAESHEQQRAVSELVAVAEFQLDQMRDNLVKSTAYNPLLGSTLNIQSTLDDTHAYFNLVRKALIDGEDFSPQTQTAYLNSANKTLAQEFDLAQQLLNNLDQLLEKRIDTMRTHLIFLCAFSVVGLLLAAYFFYCFFVVTRSGLELIRKHLNEMSEGDLRKPPGRHWGSDEPALLVGDLSTTYSSLHMLISKVHHSADALHTASNEIAAASANLGSRTEAAAASLEQQAAAIEQIGAQVATTAEHAQVAARFARDNSEVAERGGQVFGQVVTTMRDIRDSSSKIGDIIGVIDGIAFQTNILALNAAVEAARAGEAGRGFAVVASEVRSLAGRSAEAAREIKSLIAVSVESVEHGASVVEDAGKTMTDVVSNARQITNYLNDISDAAKQQATGVDEISRAIQDLDRNTQQNATIVEQTTAAAGALTVQADVLQAEIANFQVA